MVTAVAPPLERDINSKECCERPLVAGDSAACAAGSPVALEVTPTEKGRKGNGREHYIKSPLILSLRNELFLKVREAVSAPRNTMRGIYTQ